MQYRKVQSEMDSTIQLIAALTIKKIARTEKRDVDKVQDEFMASATYKELSENKTELWKQGQEAIAKRYEQEKQVHRVTVVSAQDKP
jgi:hypothetical protein